MYESLNFGNNNKTTIVFDVILHGTDVKKYLQAILL